MIHYNMGVKILSIEPTVIATNCEAILLLDECGFRVIDMNRVEWMIA